MLWFALLWAGVSALLVAGFTVSKHRRLRVPGGRQGRPGPAGGSGSGSPGGGPGPGGVTVNLQTPAAHTPMQRIAAALGNVVSGVWLLVDIAISIGVLTLVVWILGALVQSGTIHLPPAAAGWMVRTSNWLSSLVANF